MESIFEQYKSKIISLSNNPNSRSKDLKIENTKGQSKVTYTMPSNAEDAKPKGLQLIYNSDKNIVCITIGSLPNKEQRLTSEILFIGYFPTGNMESFYLTSDGTRLKVLDNTCEAASIQILMHCSRLADVLNSNQIETLKSTFEQFQKDIGLESPSISQDYDFLLKY